MLDGDGIFKNESKQGIRKWKERQVAVQDRMVSEGFMEEVDIRAKTLR